MHRFCFKKQRNFNIFTLWSSLGALWGFLGLSGALWGSRYKHYPIWEGRATHFLCIYFCFCFKNKPSYAVSTHFLRIFHWTVEPLNRWKPLNNWIVEPLNRWTVEQLNRWTVEPLNNVQATSLQGRPHPGVATVISYHIFFSAVEPLNRWTVEPLNRWTVEPLNRWTVTKMRPQR